MRMLGDSRGQTRGETDDNKKDLFLTKTSFLQTVRFLNERASAVMANTKDILLSFQFGTSFPRKYKTEHRDISICIRVIWEWNASNGISTKQMFNQKLGLWPFFFNIHLIEESMVGETCFERGQWFIKLVWNANASHNEAVEESFVRFFFGRVSIDFFIR